MRPFDSLGYAYPGSLNSTRRSKIYRRPVLDLPERLLFLTIAGYLILNGGFGMLVVPPGIPVGEAAMVVCLLWFALQKRTRSTAWMQPPVFPLVVLIWCYAIFGVALAFDTWGAFAFRSATHAVELGFLLLGMSIGVVTHKRQAWFRFFKRTLVLGCAYVLLYPLRETLITLSPTVIALAGYNAPIFFNFVTAGLLVLTFAMRVLLQPITAWRVGNIALLLSALGVLFLLVQSRVNYGILLLLVLLVAFFVPRKLKYAVATIGALAGLLMLFFAFGIELDGRIGAISGFDFIGRHFMSSFGIATGTDVEGAANGVSQRLEWWLNIFERLAANPWSLLFGLGQGVPLTGFYLADGVVVREPHNSFITTIGRYGLLGTSLFIALYIRLFKSLWRNIRLSRDSKTREQYILLLFFLFAVLVISFVEDALEKPFYAIPYYFLWGIAVTKPINSEKVR